MAAGLTKKHHRWYEPKGLPNLKVCRDCKARSWDVAEDSLCLLARSADKELNRLYRERRKAAEAADSDGGGARKGWADLEALSAKLTELDPEGDWYYEGNAHDGRGWVVSRPDAIPPTKVTCSECGRQDITTDPKFRCPSCGSDSTTTHKAAANNGRSKEATPMAEAATSTTTEEKPVDLIQLLLESLKAEGLKVKASWTPKYARLTTAEGTIGYVWKPTRSGIKVKAAATLKELGTAKKGWKDNSKEGAMATVRFSSTEAEVSQAVAGLKVAAEKLAAKKAEPKS